MTRLRTVSLSTRPQSWQIVGKCVVALCVMFIMLCAGKSSAASVEPDAPQKIFVRICLNWLPQSQFAGVIMALEKGFFAEKGLDVRLIWITPGDNPIEMLTKGEVELATATLDSALIHRAQGLPLVQLMQLHQRSTMMLVTQKEIQKLEQLNGQVVQVWNRNSRCLLTMLLEQNKVKPSRILPQSASLVPFIAGLVGGVQARDFNECLQLQEYGLNAEEYNVFSFADYGLGFVGDGLYTLQTFAEQNPQVLRQVRTAMREGWNYAFTHEQETVDTVLRYAQQNKKPTNTQHQLDMLRIIHSVMTDNGTVPAENMGTLRDKDFMFAKNVLLQAGYDLQDVTLENFVAQ